VASVVHPTFHNPNTHQRQRRWSAARSSGCRATTARFAAAATAWLSELVTVQQLLAELGGDVQALASEVLTADQAGLAECRQVL
jgi:hypothetical protein